MIITRSRLAAVFVLLLPYLVAAADPSPENVVLQLKWFHQFQFAGYYAAVEQGYYAEEGLQVEVRERSPNQDYIRQVADGAADYGIGDSGIVADYANGKPIVALAAIFQHDALVLFSKQASGIISPYEMAGKRIMYDVVGENNAPVRALLSEANLNESHYVKVPESFDDADLIQDRVDVMSGYITDRPYTLQKAGISFNIINPQNYGVDFYGDLLFTSQTELARHPGRAERFRRASLKGWQYALDHPDEIIRLIRSKYRNDLSEAQLRFEATETRKLILPDKIPLGQIETGRLRRVAEIYASLNLAKPLYDAQLDGFVYGGGNQSSGPQLSAEERQWLQTHRQIRLGIDPNFAPYESIDAQGQYIGIAPDFLRLVSRLLNVEFVPVRDKTWHETLEMAQRGELDMIAAAVKTPEREHYLSFTQAYISTPTVIIAPESSGYIGSLQMLAGQRVAVEKGYFVQELLRRDHPTLQQLEAASVGEALNLVAEGKADVYIGDAASASHALSRAGLLNLRIAGQAGYLSESRMAVSKTNPELLSALEKALTTISHAEHDAIVNRWLGLKIEQGIRPETLFKWGLPAILTFALVGYWLYRLNREVKARKRSEAELALLYTNMSLGFALHQVIRDAAGKIVDYRYLDINPAFERMTGIARQEWLNKTVRQLLPDTHCPWIASFDDLETSGEPRHFENRVEEIGRWYAIDSYKADTDRFVVLVQDITERKQTELALTQSEERFRMSQIYGGIGIWEAELLTGRQFWSEIVTGSLGFPKTAQHSWGDFLAAVHVEDRPAVLAATRAHLETGAKYDVEYRIVDADGQKRWMRSVGQAERDSEGKPLRMRGIVHDISERKAAEEKQRLWARVFSDAHEGIVITDTDANIIDVNAAFTAITGYDRAEVLGLNPRLLKSDKQPDEFFAEMWLALTDSGHWQGEIWNRRKNGDCYAELLTISALRDDAGKIVHYIGLFSDITDTKRQQQALEVLAHYDVLTQLPNRALFGDRFAQAIAHSKRSECLLAVCYLDLDGFKQVNDGYGHEAGDQLLVQVAKRIRQNLREGDTVCRLGGDEFALLFENLQSVSQCEDTLKRIHQAVAEPFELAAGPVRIAASSGVTIYPLDREEPDLLLRHADHAMYQAKLAGRNCYRLYDELAELPERKSAPPNRLELALQEIGAALEQGQFRLYYQPKVNLASGEVVGAEALIRWQHPERGLLAPAEFLPIVEGHPLEIDISNWVIRSAFAELQLWQDTGLKLQISVNVSPRHLQWPRFVPELEQLLAAHPGISSRQLELEVLESSVLDDLISVGEVLKQCYHDLGIPCVLDDFGTGYSSLTHLRHLTISAVKIDQSFVRGMIDDPDDLSIVESVIALARAFKRDVVAEGVEDIEHGVFLIHLGCHLAQGFGIARPMPATALADWIRDYRNYPAWTASARNPLHPGRVQLSLLKLQQQYWLRRLEAYLRAPADNGGYWPTLIQKKSHMNKWLERLELETSADRRLLGKLAQAQARQTLLAEQVLREHQQGRPALTGETYQRLLNANLDIIQLLEQLELYI
ncbi:EAL domain-containing protein [Methylococcaceae bacterium WWC4]|nr:EAL domain-containing protein [Methylococcaceae bacterium WWC4]